MELYEDSVDQTTGKFAKAKTAARVANAITKDVWERNRKALTAYGQDKGLHQFNPVKLQHSEAQRAHEIAAEAFKQAGDAAKAKHHERIAAEHKAAAGGGHHGIGPNGPY
jgi:hypothetical protein